jgi:hypothetical protein
MHQANASWLSAEGSGPTSRRPRRNGKLSKGASGDHQQTCTQTSFTTTFEPLHASGLRRFPTTRPIPSGWKSRASRSSSRQTVRRRSTDKRVAALLVAEIIPACAAAQLCDKPLSALRPELVIFAIETAMGNLNPASITQSVNAFQKFWQWLEQHNIPFGQGF